MLVPVPIDTKALAKAVGLAKPVVETACDLIKALLGQPCRVGGELLSDQIYAWQWGNRLRIMAKVAARLRDTKVSAASMPAGFLIPVLEAVGNVEDETLQSLWARLITNATCDPSTQHPMFVEVLKRWSADDARLFERICRESDALNIKVVARGVSGPWSPGFEELHLLSSIARLQACGVLVNDGQSTNAEGATVPISGVTLFATQLYLAISEPVVTQAHKN